MKHVACLRRMKADKSSCGSLEVRACAAMQPRRFALRDKAWLILMYTLSAFMSCALNAATVVDVRSFGARPDSTDPVATRVAFQAAFDVAKTNNAPIVVKIGPGTYLFDRSLHIFPNTKLLADSAAVFVRRNSSDRTMLMGVHLAEDGSECMKDASCAHFGYSQVVNVTVEGGIWDAAATEHDNVGIMHLCHGSNVIVRAATFRRATDHMLNLSGTSDALVENCVFKDMVRYAGTNPDYWNGVPVGSEERYGTIESVHLDATAVDGEAGNYPEDGTVCRRVVVRNCSFDGVFAGVGNHHVSAAVAYAKRLDVTGCTFSNILSSAVMAFGFDGVCVSDCEMTDGQRLVWGYASQGVVADHCSVVASKFQSVAFMQCAASRIGYNEFDSPVGHAITVDGGDATIVGNNIVNGEQFGVSLTGGADVMAISNRISGVAGYGFCAANGSRLDLRENEVYDVGKAAYYFVDAVAGSCVRNGITSQAATFGIQAQRSAIEIVDCMVNGSGSHGIVLMDCEDASVVRSTVLDAGEHGVYFAGGTANVRDCTIRGGSQGHGVYLSSVASANVVRNAIAAFGKNGICILQSEDVVVDENEVNRVVNHGIYAAESTNVSVSGNLVADVGNCGFYMDQTAGAVIKGNSVQGSGWPSVWIKTSPSCDVTGNTLADSSQEGIYCTCSAQCVVSSNLVTGATKIGIRVDGTDGNRASARIFDNDVTSASASGDIRVCSVASDYEVSGNVCRGVGFTMESAVVGVTEYHPADARIVSVDLTSADTADVKWENLAGVTGYFVEYAPSADFPASATRRSENIVDGSANCGISGLASSGTWYVRVRSYHAYYGSVYESLGDPAFCERVSMSGTPDGIYYSVHFDANGGSGVMADQSGFVYGTAKVLSPNAFTYAGYLFAGWSRSQTAATASYADGARLSRPSPAPQKGGTITLYAVWTRDTSTYSVQFNGNGATSGQMADQLGFVPGKGGRTLAPNKFTRVGYDFLGWAKFPASTSPLWTDGANLVTSTAAGGTLVLYAVWQLREGSSYTVRFNANGGSGSMADKTDFIPGVASKLPKCKFTNTGYIFLGWARTASAQQAAYLDEGSFSSNAAAGSTVTLYAVWALDSSTTYSVHFDGNGATSGQMADQLGFVPGKGGRTLTPNKFLNVGYEFLGWSKYPKSTNPTWTDGAVLVTSTQVGTRLVLYAVWRLNESITYSVAFDANGGRGTMPVQPAFVYGKGRALLPNAFTRDGYVFKGWNRSMYATAATYVDCAMVYRPDPQVPVGGTMRLFAVWERDATCGSVHFDANGGAGKMDDQLGFRPGETKALAANSFVRPGYLFVGWAPFPDADEAYYVDGADFAGVTATGDEQTLYAVWAIDPECYTVHFEGNGANIGQMGDQLGFRKGKGGVALAYNAFENPGHRFAGWSKWPLATTPTWQDGAMLVTSTEPGTTLTLYAVWEQAPDTYAIAYDANGGDGAMPMQQGLAYDTPVTLLGNAFTREGFDFVGWTDAPVVSTVLYADGEVVECAKPDDGSYMAVRLYAVWRERRGYRIEFNKNEGSGLTSSIWLQPDELGQLPRLAAADGLDWARRGFSFLGWSLAANSREKAFDDWECVHGLADEGETVRLYALWALDPSCYAITFIRNDGAGTWRTVGFPYGTKTRMPSLANGLGWGRRGYEFKGWELTTANANDNTRPASWKGDWAYVAEPTAPGKTLNVYARWSLKPGYYQVRFNKNDGSSKWRTLGFQLDVSTKLSTIAALGWEREGHRFVGWASNKANAEAGRVWKLDGEWVRNVIGEGKTLSIYAIWEPAQ